MDFLLIPKIHFALHLAARGADAVLSRRAFPSHFPLSDQQIGNNSSLSAPRDRRDREKKESRRFSVEELPPRFPFVTAGASNTAPHRKA